MSALPAALTAGWLLLHLLTPGISGIKCLRTEAGYQPHLRDCSEYAKGCRVIVKPYKIQNNSAVATCRSDEKHGDFTFDCAVDCLERDKLDWNEVVCCKQDSCNGDIKAIISKNYCYVSKKRSTTSALDSIVICADTEMCAMNLETEDTQCVSEAECKKSKWSCCPSKQNCGELWSIRRWENTVTAKEVLDARALGASAAVVAISLVLVCVASF